MNKIIKIFLFVIIINVSLIPQENYRFFVNNINLPINNTGLLADVDISPEGTMGRYDGLPFLFSGGFYLSGLDGNNVWGSSIIANYFNDYKPGPVDTSIVKSKIKFYLVKSTDPPFGESWMNWQDAVDLGADFYDGNNNGIYDPFDENENGTWNIGEDMPLLLGDETLWFIYNDGVTSVERLWETTEPKQIEVAQTMFASKKPGLEDIIFIRYKITNRSSNIYDDVYFSHYSDPDIGEYTNDHMGSDSLLNSGYSYDAEPDEWSFGENPPAYFVTLLQGPVVESEKISDTAYINLGNPFGVKFLTSAFNLGFTSQISIMTLNLEVAGPSNLPALRNYSRGLTYSGGTIDPCNFDRGSVFGEINCNDVDPTFWFSGDPISQTGWIQTNGWELQLMLNTGPFKLKPDEPQEIILALIVGRGMDAINSIEVARDNVNNAIELYKNNFDLLTYNPPPPTNPVTSYILHQNYPNPFNNTTTIKVEMPEDGFLSIKLYDVLGRKVRTLVSENKRASRYKLKLDASDLSSGVYYYKVNINNFSETKKMILLK